MEQNLTLSLSVVLATIFLYLIFKIRGLNQQVATAAHKQSKMTLQLSTLATNNQYLTKKVEGMREELDEACHTEEEI